MQSFWIFDKVLVSHLIIVNMYRTFNVMYSIHHTLLKHNMCMLMNVNRIEFRHCLNELFKAAGMDYMLMLFHQLYFASLNKWYNITTTNSERIFIFQAIKWKEKFIDSNLSTSTTKYNNKNEQFLQHFIL